MGNKSNVVVGLGAGTIKIGTYGQAEGSADDLGYTEGGVELAVEREYFEKIVDQEIGPLELFKTAERATLKLTLAEATLENLAKAIDYPAAAITASTLVFGGSATVNELTIYLNVLGPSGAARKYTFHKCVITSAATHSYKKDDKTMIEMEILVLQDTSKTTDQQLASIVDTGGDTTAPTVVLTTPAEAGTVTKDAKGIVLLTITETNALNENTIIYGDTVQIINTTAASEGLVAGSIVYDSVGKTITFTPTSNWVASDTIIAMVSTGLQDVAGNALAATYIGEFSVTA